MGLFYAAIALSLLITAGGTDWAIEHAEHRYAALVYVGAWLGAALMTAAVMLPTNVGAAGAALFLWAFGGLAVALRSTPFLLPRRPDGTRPDPVGLNIHRIPGMWLRRRK
ncbi:hypothetical protein [Prescottella agglutinans]|uniref:Uncharacterized protein n=1 Tax=Prescottella agglutinans TaxID=1644129 RepID=A0ABT6MIX9_9NOCA|nr:hypothetical protein [Prescottella agglutinans]MDH6284276.1 hypothetical protein [Prescottella agglutinans]